MNADETIAAGRLMIEYGESVKAGKPIEVQYKTDSSELFNDCNKAPAWEWNRTRYRRKPTTRRVPIGPEDVPQGSEFMSEGSTTRYIPCCITESGVHFASDTRPLLIDWGSLKNFWKINRNDSKGWVPCWKEVE